MPLRESVSSPFSSSPKRVDRPETLVLGTVGEEASDGGDRGEDEDGRTGRPDEPAVVMTGVGRGGRPGFPLN